jgi:hypothetical protein
VKGLLLLLCLKINLVHAHVEMPEKQFSKIWLKTEIIPMNFSWQDLGFSKEASFTTPISDAWKTWIAENLPANVADVEMCTQDCLNFLGKWEIRPREEVIADSSGEYSNGVWLKVDLNVWKQNDGTTFNWEGRTVLLDINTKRLLGSVAFSPTTKHFQQLQEKDLNSTLASHIYGTALFSFTQLTKTLGQGFKLNQMARVKVVGHRNLIDALKVMKLLQTRGSYLGLSASLEDFNKAEAQLLCFFQGEEKTFSDLLSQLKELKLSESYTLVNQSTGPGHVIQLVTE